MGNRTTWLLLACWALLALPGLQGGTTDAGPALGVARISLVNGDIAVRRGDSGDSVAATVNMAVVEGDAVQSTGASRAEIQLDQGNIVRIGGDTEIELLELASKQFRASLAGGVAVYSELADSEADVDIETPLAAVRPMQPGRYRVTVSADLTRIEIRKGEAEIAFQASTTRLRNGQSMTVRSDEDGEVAFEIGKARSADSLDRWAADRDKALQRANSRRYISRDIYGAEDLDRHGSWRWVTSLGFCWFPRVTRAWVPYRFGRWIWLDYYGWTWHGHEPWGWAPYHWGRWQYHAAYGWGWFPGAPQLRHVWRPALVTFVGFNPVGRLRPGSGFAGIGWVPLAPGERYAPWYGRRYYGRSHADTIVVDSRSRFFDSYRNARDRRAVSYVDSRQLSMGASHTPRALRTGQAHSATTIRGRLPVVPARSSQGRLLASSTSVRSRTAAGSGTGRSAGRLRDGSARIPFEERRRGLQASVEAFYRNQRTGAATAASGSSSTAGRPGSQPATGSTPRTLRTAGSATRPAPAASPVQPSATRTAAARAGDTPSSSSSVRAQPSEAGARTPASSGIRIGTGRAATPAAGTRGTLRTPTTRAATGQVSTLPSIRRGTSSTGSARAPAGSRSAAGQTTRESLRLPQLGRGAATTNRPAPRTGYPSTTSPVGIPATPRASAPGASPRAAAASSSTVRRTPSGSRTGTSGRTRRAAPVFAPRTATRIGSPGAAGLPSARSPAGTAGAGTRPRASAGTRARATSTRPSASSKSGSAASTRRTPTSVSSRRPTSQPRAPAVFAPRTSSRSRPGTISGRTPSIRRASPATPRTGSRPSTSQIGTRTSRRPSSAARQASGPAGGSTTRTNSPRTGSSQGAYAPRTQSRSATRSSGSTQSGRTLGSSSRSTGTRSRIGTRTSSPSSASRRSGTSSSTRPATRSSSRGSFGTNRGSSSSSRVGGLSTSRSRSGSLSSRPSSGSSRPSYSRSGSPGSRSSSSTSGSRTTSSRGTRSSSSSVRNGER